MSAVAEQNTYRIALPVFEGPFDLLLFFIERDELDIHDIPIARVSMDFLDYLRQMDALNIELASEFILVASTLMRIKAKMLLPRPELNEVGEEIDPREELVRRLLEYKKYKSVVDELDAMADIQAEKLWRVYMREEEAKFAEAATNGPEEELANLDLYALMRAFQRVWERHQNELKKPRHVIRPYPYTMEQVKEDILATLSRKKRIDFSALVLDTGERVFAVFAFLSVLELFQYGKLHLVIGEGFNNFWLEAIPSQASAAL